MSSLQLCDCQGDLMKASGACERRGAQPCVYPDGRRTDVTRREQERWASADSSASPSLPVHLPVSPDMSWEVMITGLCAEFSGHAALQISLAILHGSRCSNRFPRRLVSCLVKWLTFWFNQHPCLPDELDHYQKCTGSAMSLTCQNQTHLLIYLLQSPWEEWRNTVCAQGCLSLVLCQTWLRPGDLEISISTLHLLKTHIGGLEKKKQTWHSSLWSPERPTAICAQSNSARF